jgi:hypothetical protein
MIGLPAFEPARGVVMAVRRCTADDAMALLTEAIRRTNAAPEDLVASLRSQPRRGDVLRLLKARFRLTDYLPGVHGAGRSRFGRGSRTVP